MKHLNVSDKFSFHVNRDKITNETSVRLAIYLHERSLVADALESAKFSDNQIDEYIKQLKTTVSEKFDAVDRAYDELQVAISNYCKENPIQPDSLGYQVKSITHGAVKLPGNGKNKYWVPVQVNEWAGSDYHILCGLTGRVYIQEKDGETTIWVQSINKKHAEYHDDLTIQNFKDKVLQIFTKEYFDTIPSASHDFKWVKSSEIEYGIADLGRNNNYVLTQAAEKVRWGITGYLASSDSVNKQHQEMMKSYKYLGLCVKDTQALQNPNTKPVLILRLEGADKVEFYCFSNDKIWEGWTTSVLKRKNEGTYDTNYHVMRDQTIEAFVLMNEVSQKTIDNNEFFGYFINKLISRSD